MTKAKTVSRRPPKPYSDEVRERAVRLIREQRAIRQARNTGMACYSVKIVTTARLAESAPVLD